MVYRHRNMCSFKYNIYALFQRLPQLESKISDRNQLRSVYSNHMRNNCSWRHVLKKNKRTALGKTISKHSKGKNTQNRVQRANLVLKDIWIVEFQNALKMLFVKYVHTMLLCDQKILISNTTTERDIYELLLSETFTCRKLRYLFGFYSFQLYAEFANQLIWNCGRYMKYFYGFHNVL